MAALNPRGDAPQRPITSRKSCAIAPILPLPALKTPTTRLSAKLREFAKVRPSSPHRVSIGCQTNPSKMPLMIPCIAGSSRSGRSRVTAGHAEAGSLAPTQTSTHPAKYSSSPVAA